jgi:hypothetical protein
MSSSVKLRHHRFGLVDRLVDGLLQLVVLDDDELDAHRGLEADLVERVQVGGIGDREEQALAALHQRQHAVLLQQLVADRANRVEVRHDESRSSSGTPNSFEAEMAMSRAVARLLETRWVTRLMRFSLALAIASCMAPRPGARPGRGAGRGRPGRLGYRHRSLLKHCHSWTYSRERSLIDVGA